MEEESFFKRGFLKKQKFEELSIQGLSVFKISPLRFIIINVNT